ncbi:MAG: UDP-2,3-diacylglucosamine diphosphatase LpxI [Deltaproteobacteria bacterium]|jgi:DUF1009 family protein|nr:UDP-2,3-diacylglucosamine diphosphatase LpxI [Deltaproteobacteria bacterium]
MINNSPVGLIAGNRTLPVIAAKALKARGVPLALCSLAGEAEEELKNYANFHITLSLGSLRPMVDFFKSSGVSELFMAGGIDRDNLLENYDPDDDAIALMESLSNFQTDTILRGLASYLERAGLKLISVTDIVPEILVKPGLLSETPPSPELLADLRLAFVLARELGRLDVGQTVVVSDLIAVALEGADGTDATIRRGASLSKRPIAVAKVLKPTQDTRFDLPVIGPPTLELLADLKAGGLVLDAKGLIILEEDKCIEIANSNKMALLAWMEAPEKPKTLAQQLKQG